MHATNEEEEEKEKGAWQSVSQSALEMDRPAHSAPLHPQPAITVTPQSLRRPDSLSVSHSPVTEVSGASETTAAPTDTEDLMCGRVRVVSLGITLEQLIVSPSLWPDNDVYTFKGKF